MGHRVSIDSRQLGHKRLASEMTASPLTESVTCFSWQFGIHQMTIFRALFVAAVCYPRASFATTNPSPAFSAGFWDCSCDHTLSFPWCSSSWWR